MPDRVGALIPRADFLTNYEFNQMQKLLIVASIKLLDKKRCVPLWQRLNEDEQKRLSKALRNPADGFETIIGVIPEVSRAVLLLKQDLMILRSLKTTTFFDAETKTWHRAQNKDDARAWFAEKGQPMQRLDAVWGMWSDISADPPSQTDASIDDTLMHRLEMLYEAQEQNITEKGTFHSRAPRAPPPCLAAIMLIT
eukprot:2345052-Rhodomonas_salina.2